MANKPPMRVALDLETTGLHPEQDTILEIAAIKFQGKTIIDRLETFVAPGRAIPYRVQRLTTILPQQLVGAPPFEAIASGLQRFLGNYPIVGHSIPFDVGFLQRRGLAQNNALVDTFELATVLLPSLPSYGLGQVAESLGLPTVVGRHRAMVDTMLAMEVFLALHERLEAVELSMLQELANLDAPREWPLLAFFRQELRERQERDGIVGGLARGTLGDRFAAQLGMDPRVLSFAIAQPGPVVDGGGSAPSEGGQAAFSDGVAIEQLEKQVEVIAEQATCDEEAERVGSGTPLGYQSARMAMQQALEHDTPLLMEVTIGGNDYTPALLPALEWAIAAEGRRLVIACAQQQQAMRLMKEVLPRLQRSLGSQASVAYLEEKGGYLCVHRWFGAALRRTSGELTAEQARGLAKLGLWAQQTVTGERSELTMLPHEITAWGRISSGVERLPLAGDATDSGYERCTYRRKGLCFVSRAEEKVNAASIVVTTHAGLLDDLTSGLSLTSSIDRRLILDADLLEDEIARWSGKELAQSRLIGLLHTIGTELPNGQFQGLLALAAPTLRENGPGGLSTTHTIAKAALDGRLLAWFQTLGHACAAIDALFQAFASLLREYQQQGSNGSGMDKGRSTPTGRMNGPRTAERPDQPLRLTSHARNLSAWADVERAWQQTSQRLQSIIDLLNEAQGILLTGKRGQHKQELGSGESESCAAEFAAIAQRLREQKALGQQALSLAGMDTVHWLRMPPAPPPAAQQMVSQRHSGPPTAGMSAAEHFPVLYAQQVQTPALIRKLLLHDGACAIFAGAALSVDHSFSFFRARLGLDGDPCPALSVVTERHEQTLLYVPNDVPEPNMPQYQRHLDEALIQLATALDGGVVVLCTAHSALRSSYAAIKPILEARDILVLGQGIDGSPRQLWQMFTSQTRTVVLGVGSFWDGIGDGKEAPACIVVTRLPMPVLNDPPLAARAEQYSDQLHQLTVPLASLRLRRALNRLAWSGARRNAVILFDRRVLSKEYGATILHSLPRCSQRQDGVSHMPETILDWLTDTGGWE